MAILSNDVTRRDCGGTLVIFVSIIISADMFVIILDSNSPLILVTKDLKFTHVKIFVFDQTCNDHTKQFDQWKLAKILTQGSKVIRQ